MHKIDFAKLSLQDALDLAILIEDEAKERYEEFADNLGVHHTPDAAQFFRTMAGNEAKHGAELLERRRALFQDAPLRVSRDMLWDVEAPAYDQPRMFMTARQAMEVALESEVKAYGFFGAALAFVSNPEVRTLFEELKGEEIEHQEMVKAVLARMPADDDAGAGFDADEPVAQ